MVELHIPIANRWVFVVPLFLGMLLCKLQPTQACKVKRRRKLINASMITIWKLAPALVTGNVLIIKSSELSPLYGLRLAELVKEAGFPAGVVNIVTGEGATAGQALSEHMEIRKVAFTGSALAGRKILQAASRTNLKKVSLELGGKGPSIVFDDCDLENALLWTRIGITANNGQICAAGSRIYVQASIYDRFIEAYKKASADAPTVAGNPLDASTTKGPVVSRVQHEKILDFIRQGKQSGAKLLFGGDRIGDKGYFVQNTAFADVGDDATIMREEIFGPVAVSSISSLRIVVPFLTRMWHS
jgi:aldehyde dehydrogenase (NAD+)